MRNLALMLSASVVALAASEPVRGQEATQPDWLRMPSAYDMMSVYPREALRRNKNGEAGIRCKVSRQGALYDCEVLEETPEGMGFGAAAIALTPQFQMKPATVNGQAVVDTVNIPIRFRAPAPSASYIASNMGMSRFLASPIWAEAPTYSETLAAYPQPARDDLTGGSATVGCVITEDLALHRCKVIAEEPRRKGFGRAGLTLAEHFRLAAPDDPEIDLPGAETQFRVTFAPEMLSATERLVGKPQWTDLPSGQAIAGAYPAAARAANFTTARVQMRCAVAETGAVEACQVISETPEGLGFGEAALSLAPHFRLSLWSAEGLPTIGGQVIIPLRYEGLKRED